MTGLAEGIYFNLSNEDYHADPALSHSGMTKVLISWPDYWMQSCHNPDRKLYQATDAMKFGERSGMLLLEPKKFQEKYSTYNRDKNTGKGVYLSSVEYGRIKESIDGVLTVPEAAAHFKDGYPEVSIFWRDAETGIMLRARIDYLRTFGAIDFKRIASVDNWTIGKAVKSQGLDIQAHLYLEAITAARAMLKGLKPKEREVWCESAGADLAWICSFMDDTDLLFRFLFQRSTPPYIWEFRELDAEVLAEGQNATRAAINRYVDGSKRFGFGRPPCGSAQVKTISQFHIPRRDYDYE